MSNPIPKEPFGICTICKKDIDGPQQGGCDGKDGCDGEESCGETIEKTVRTVARALTGKEIEFVE